MLHVSKKSGGFKYCLDLYVVRDKGCIGHCCKSGVNLLDKIKTAYESGYAGIELWHGDVVKYCNEVGPVEGLGDFIKGLGLKVPSYKVVESWDNLEPMKLASQLGATSCVVKLLGDKYKGDLPDFSEMVEGYKRVLDVGDELSIDPSLEFMVLARKFNSINAVIDIIDEVNHPRAKLVLDTWHLWRKDDNNFNSFPVERIDPSCISVVHFTDARRDVPRQKQVDGDRKMPGDGVLNLSKFSGSLSSVGFNGWLSLNVYDRSLWDRDPLEVATEGFYKMLRVVESNKFASLGDSAAWSKTQKDRCSGLWAKQYLTHLDPRIKITSRDGQLKEMLETYLNGSVLDFKCGFSPLSDFVTVGFDGFDGCIDYLSKKHPDANWLCCSDKEFADDYSAPLDVLMHIGLGDSITEVDSHIKIKEKCNPGIVIIECAANKDGLVDESRAGNRKRWNRLKNGLTCIKEHFYQTDMPDRPYRLLFIGSNDAVQV